jgi:uncharacterized protein YigE (DUF2233 family)
MKNQLMSKHWKISSIGIFLIPILAIFFISSAFGQNPEIKKASETGIEYCSYPIDPDNTGDTANKIHILRIDPSRVKLTLLTASEHEKKLRTTAEWCKEFHLVAAINAGMFLKDYSTNVGYLRNESHVQNGKWNSKYRSVLAFNPKKVGLPPAAMIDLEEPATKERLKDYHVVVQNLRLMKADGINVWAKSEKKWSETALGIDKKGRILFLFCKSPMSMWKFNELVSSLRLEITRLMHLEGGPLASLSIHTAGKKIDLAGGYETGLDSGEMTGTLLPIPNVIGVQLKRN